MIETSIYVGDLRAYVGSRRDIHIEVPGESFSTRLCAITDDISCDFTLESVSHGIVIHGVMQLNYAAQCSYGLVDIVEPLVVSVANELFHENKTREKNTNDDESYSFQGDDLDIEQMIRDAIVTHVPLAPVCGHGPNDCVVCSTTVVPFLGNDESVADEVTHPDVTDPRWDALKDFPRE